MSMYVRLMRRDDIDQVTRLDREAFPTEWPPTNFSREMENRLAFYVVACDGTPPAPASPAPPPVPEPGISGWFKRLFGRSDHRVAARSEEKVIGYAGMWVLADEAHIMSIASRQDYRRKGVGEILLIAIFDLALKHYARTVTLEVRISNTAAQSLYFKYGFKQTGLRKGYYLDNREDALVMSTDYIGSGEFKELVRRLRQAHEKKWGATRFELDKDTVPAPWPGAP
jgi:ribosomal-protein-alanine N-acetyltransferase